MTAGAGLQHAEMFPLIHQDRENPLHLFQIWLNLPTNKKFSQPHYKMLWADEIPTVAVRDDINRSTEITMIAGQLEGVTAPEPAPDSWAANPDNEVGIWIIKMDPLARWVLPAASQPLNRSLYFFDGSTLTLAGIDLPPETMADLLVEQDLVIQNGEKGSRMLLLQGRPIAEPVVQYGPFVMNNRAEIQQAFDDYRRTQFGGWPWDRTDPVHPRSVRKYAKYADGREESR
jgi:redox-sensitive bicupin YhaK (pirin superfamily)